MTGHDRALDEARALRDESRRVIAALQARYAEATGVRGAESPPQQRARLLRRGDRAARRQAARVRRTTPSFIHRQTLAGQVRFTTTELGELEAKIANAANRALGIELETFEQLARDR